MNRTFAISTMALICKAAALIVGAALMFGVRLREAHEGSGTMPSQFPPNDLKNYKQLTAEDRRTFDRWVGANALFGLIAMVALITMAVMGSWFPETGAGQKLVSQPEQVLVGGSRKGVDRA